MSSGDPHASETKPQSAPAEDSQAEAQTSPSNPRPEEAVAAAPPSQPAGEAAADEAAADETAPTAAEQRPEESSEAQAAAPSNADASNSDAPSTAPPGTAIPSRSSAVARGSGPLAARGLGIAKPSSPAASLGKSAGKPARADKGQGKQGGGGKGKSADAGKAKPAAAKASTKPSGPALGPLKAQPKVKPAGVDKPQRDEGAAGEDDGPQRPRPSAPPARVAIPNLRQPLSDDLQSQLEAELAAADVDSILSGSAGMENRKEIEEGERIRGRVLKVDEDSVYVSLGGPDEGAVARTQFEELPEIGSTIETIVRGFNREDGLYNLVVPGQAMDVSDWEDLEEGTVVEAHVTAANTGGLEVTVGNIRGFIPISQIAQYRVEDASEFVGQRLMCIVTECNPRKKNLVLSRRAVLEREREEQRQQQLEKMEPGDVMEGTIRSVKDFGAFVDLGGVDGLIHVTKLSWDHIKHPSDVLEVGQKVKVKVEKVDKQTGKIALSYRDLLENPWDTLESTISVGSVVKGTVTRIANFGAFVRIGSGIEGLVHISELAGHRVSNVSSVLKEGDEVAVKVLSIERESQRIALSIKQAQSKAADAAVEAVEETDEPPRELAVKRQHTGPLKGGVGKESGGAQFGLKW